MKKFIFFVTVALTMLSCTNTKDYKTQCEELAQQLIEACEKQDTAAVLAADSVIREQEAAIIAASDSASLVIFREAMKEARTKSAAFVTSAKLDQGANQDENVKELIQDALNGSVDITAVTTSIDAGLEKEANK